MPTAAPTTSQPSGLPTPSPTDSIANEFRLMFIVLANFPPDLPPDSTPRELWQNLTAEFVKTYWDGLYPFQSPFFVREVSVRIANDTATNYTGTERLNEWPPSTRRFLQEPSNATSDTSAPDVNEGSNTTLQPTTQPTMQPTKQPTQNPSPQSPSPLLFISFRLRIFYRVENNSGLDLEKFNRTGDIRDALWLDPFTGESPSKYLNALGFFQGVEDVVQLVSYGFDLDTAAPTTMPTQVPTLVPTAVPTTAAPTDPPQAPPTPVLDSPSDRRIIVFVVVVVFLSIVIAAGYLYYLVRKEDRQPILGAIPEDLEDREYYVETRMQRGPVVSSDLPTHSRPSAGESEPLNPQPAALGNEQDDALPGATLAPFPTSVSGASSKSGPPPMAVLDDVPHEHQDLYGALGGDDAPDGINGVDPMEVNPSFDSGDGSTAPPAFDMMGFQMNVQNLDDI
eukprot:scaffold1351_cov176-Amphora_coffeaeformis.AAC.4